MDIIISAPQGAGKSVLAQKIIGAYMGFTKMAAGNIPTCTISEPRDLMGKPRTIARRIHTRGHEVPQQVLIFDGAIVSPSCMIKAVSVVKIYREVVNTDVLAIYIEQGGAVILTDNAIRPIPLPNLKQKL